jgi:catechol 2,3-dioxygenase-like lactoylglutathione lyase family enzyme
MLRRINFQTLPVRDFARARDFYRDRLGMVVQTDAPYGDSRWIFMAIPGADTMLHFGAPEEIQIKPGTPALCLVCDDVDAEVARLRAEGVTIHAGPADAEWQPGVRWALLHDSEDNLILIQSSIHET